MAQKKTVRKPAAKRSKAKPKRSVGGIGWLAAVAIGVAWLASDGRPIAYVQNAWVSEKAGSRERVQERLAMTGRQIALTEAPQLQDSTTSSWATPTERPRPSDVTGADASPLATQPPRSKLIVPTKREDDVARLIRQVPEPFNVAAITLSSGPRPSIVMPLRNPISERSSPRPQTSASQAPLTSTGSGERHATRALAVHRIPDPGTERVATIGSGSTVTVLKSEGAWRLVRTPDAQGWVDGRYLAGEQASEPASSTMTPMPPPAAFAERQRGAGPYGFALAPIPPAAIANE